MLSLLKYSILIWIALIGSVISAPTSNTKDNAATCKLSASLIREIDSYASVVNNILNTAVNGSFKGKTWDDLAFFTDKFGPRLTGTKNLEDSIDYVLQKASAQGFDNVHGEVVKVPHWVRGEESATLLQPRKKNIAMLGHGYSVGTPPEGITADAIVVNTFDEMIQRANEVRGKIVVFNQEFITYLETADYQDIGASRAAELGAVAVLVRSITPFSLYTPHAGVTFYWSNVTKIPSAAITAEDATLLRRIAGRGERLVINLKMQAQNLPEVESRNIVADLTGCARPEKVVVVSGHIDSWDVGEGAMDDGGGMFISWNALRLLKQLNLHPKRTVRLIVWTGEEFGLIGAEQYFNAHKAEQSNLQFVMESDVGTFQPLGLGVNVKPEVECILRRVLKLFAPIGELGISRPSAGPDTDYWADAGVPTASLWDDYSKYFWYHHTNADTMLVEDPHYLDLGTAIFAAVSYVLADISVDLPHGTSTQG